MENRRDNRNTQTMQGKYSQTQVNNFFDTANNFSDDVEDIKEKPVISKKGLKIFGKIIRGIFITFISILLVIVITGTIVVSALTFYVMDFMDEASGVTIDDIEMSYNTDVYATNSNDKLVKLYEVKSGVDTPVPVDIDQIPQYVRNAFVCTEDERFYDHDGVDYKRTFSAFLNMFIHIYNTNQGGSTITQQLVKNITGDNEQSPARKIREIFRAMQLEKSYSKDEILDAYLNYIGFGGSTVGIEKAAEKYFGKHASELDIAEAASLAAIPKSPNTFNPFADKDANLKRQKYVLGKMYENGAISYDEYEKALHEHLVFTDSDDYVNLNKETDVIDDYDSSKPTTWVVDTAINEFAAYLEDKYNLSHQEAISRINKGGYQIYTTANLTMQDYVEQKYLDMSNLTDLNLVTKTLDDGSQIQAQSAFIAMNYKGEIQCVVGATGEKTDSLCWNYATMEKRQPGSAIKPITTYGCAIESGRFGYGSLIEDKPLEINGKQWPTNYSTDSSRMVYSNKEVSLYYGLEKSLNTISARLCDALTPDAVFNFATEKMGLDLLEHSEDGTATDDALSPLSVGALSYGVTLENLVGAYIPYGNGGTRYNPHIISKVTKGNGEIVYENDGSPQQAVDPETAYIMNKLLQNVITDGTGKNAQLTNKTVAGKTGTTQNWNDLLFVGLTEDFVSGVWVGYPERQQLSSYISTAKIWKNIIGEYANNLDTGAEYPESDSVIKAYICTKTGKIATDKCPKGEIGYWRSDNPLVCDECGGTEIAYADEEENTTESYYNNQW